MLRGIHHQLSAFLSTPKSFSLFTRTDDGNLHFVESTETFEDARDRAVALSKLWPREYIIFDEARRKFLVDRRRIN
jgi:hypothetical protein